MTLPITRFSSVHRPDDLTEAHDALVRLLVDLAPTVGLSEPEAYANLCAAVARLTVAMVRTRLSAPGMVGHGSQGWVAR